MRTYDIRVGDKIKIINMSGEPQYSGREGIVELIDVDPWGDKQAHGTWGSLCLYPHIDDYEILDRGGNK